MILAPGKWKISGIRAQKTAFLENEGKITTAQRLLLLSINFFRK